MDKADLKRVLKYLENERVKLMLDEPSSETYWAFVDASLIIEDALTDDGHPHTINTFYA